MESCFAHLNSGLDASFIFLPDGHDPDSLVREEGKELFLGRLNESTPLHQYFFIQLAKDINLQKPAGKTQLINRAKPYLQKMSDGSYKQLLIDDLARLTHIDNHRVNGLINDNAPGKIINKLQKLLGHRYGLPLPYFYKIQNYIACVLTQFIQNYWMKMSTLFYLNYFNN